MVACVWPGDGGWRGQGWMLISEDCAQGVLTAFQQQSSYSSTTLEGSFIKKKCVKSNLGPFTLFFGVPLLNKSDEF